MAAETGSSYSFSDFPEDVQLSILSLLTPDEIANFACTSKHFLHLYRNDTGKLWFSLCDRRWGAMTKISRWGQQKISYKFLYKTLHKWDNLIGFWRQCGTQRSSPTSSSSSVQVKPPSLLFFEWGPSFLSGSQLSPAEDGTYRVVKTPFLWMGISPEGQIVNYLDPEGGGDDVSSQLGFSDADSDLDIVPVNVDFIGSTHLIVEEDVGFTFTRSLSSGSLRGEDGSKDGEEAVAGGSPEETLEFYQYYANRTTPAADRAWRRQRKRDKDRQARRRRLRRWETEHFLKIADSSPTPGRPLQGLWKGICEDMKLEFYLVAYDGLGISCRRVGDLSERFSSCTPMFWTSNPTFMESPLSPEEALIYDSRTHLRPHAAMNHVHVRYPETDNEVVSRVMNVNSSFDLVLPSLAETAANPWRVEGRIWQYKNGTFGFGFLRDSFIVDLRHIAQNGCLLDTIGPCSN